jgi:signal transduction histidine kinase
MSFSALDLFAFFFLSVALYQAGFNFLQYGVNKKKEYLFYALYLIIILLNFVQNFSDTKLIASLKINNFYYNLFTGLPINFLVNVSYMFFFNRYFQLSTVDKPLHRNIINLALINTICAAVCFAFIIAVNGNPANWAIRLIQLITFILAIYPLIILWQRKLKHYYYILLGSTILGISFLLSVFLAVYNDWAKTHYSTDAFAALGIFGEIFIFNYALQYKFNQQEKELLLAVLEKEKILDNEHLRLSADLHDEVGSSLSSVHILSMIVQKKMPDADADTKNYLAQITQQVSHIKQSISDIVWGFRNDLNTIDDILVRLNELIQQTLEPNNIKYVITVMPKINAQPLNSMQRSNLILVFKEGINNIIKYADATQVLINLDKENGIFYLKISDNGVGFLQTKEALKKGNGLRNMDRRMQQLNGKLEIVSTLNKGTTLQFSFPL